MEEEFKTGGKPNGSIDAWKKWPRQVDREPEAYRNGSLDRRKGDPERKPWTHGKKPSRMEGEPQTRGSGALATWEENL